MPKVISHRAVVKFFNCEPTQFQAIIMKKAIKYEANVLASRKVEVIEYAKSNLSQSSRKIF